MEIQFTTETNIKTCQNLWKKFSPNIILTDLWDYRSCFNTAYGNRPYFIVGKISAKSKSASDRKNEIIGFLPLEFHKPINKYIFFGGGDWNEKLKFYIKEKYKKEALPFFLAQIPKNKGLWNICESELNYLPELTIDEPTYFLNPKDYHFDINEYFSNFSKKHKRNLHSELKKIEELKPEIIFNNFKHIDKLIELNKQKFKEESLLNENLFSDAFRLLIKNKSLKNKIKLISIIINNETKACGLILIHNNIYNFLQEGTSTDIPNLSKYLRHRVIANAFKAGAERIDFMADDCNWKERWQLKKEMMYKIN